jgi:3-hydroxybutyryl-CoA dehydrogenase
MSAIQRVGVIGGGQMGAGIAEVCARHGHDVVVAEADARAAAAAEARIGSSLDKAVSRGKLSEADASTTRSSLRVVDDLAALADRDLVVEAVVEDEAVKVGLFRRLDEIVTSPTAILASNTSSIPIAKLATATSRPEHVLGLHFFNPVPVLPLVELIPSLLTGEDVVATARQFVEALGKTAIHSQDRAGFVVNSLLVPYILSAIRMLDSGFASAEDIDQGMVLGCAHPMGPLRLADLIGLDTVKAVAESMYEEFKEPLYSPPPLLLRMVETGLVGVKAGRGFHDHR